MTAEIIEFQTSAQRKEVRRVAELQRWLTPEPPAFIEEDEWGYVDHDMAARWQPYFDVFGIPLRVSDLTGDQFGDFIRELGVLSYMVRMTLTDNIPLIDAPLSRYAHAVIAGKPKLALLPDLAQMVEQVTVAK